MRSRLALRQGPLVALFLFVSLASVSAQTVPTKLEVGRTIEKPLGPGQSHAYTIVLAEKQYLQFVVEQHGIDVMVRVLSPSGEAIARIDSPNGIEGPENGSILSVGGGTYTIIVAPLDQTGEEATPLSAGRYEIKTIELRDATEDELKVGAGEEYRKKKAFALLNEVIESLPNVQQVQTRVRIKQQAAQLLWKTDETRSLKLLTESISDAQDYVSSIPLDDENYYEAFSWSQQVRMGIVQILAMHDPERALELLISTRKSAGSEAEQAASENDEKQFELSLAGQIAVKNPQRAYQLAEASLKSGYSSTILNTIGQLRRTNADLGAKLSKLLTTKLLAESFLDNQQAIEILLTLMRGNQIFIKPDSSAAVQSLQVLSAEDTKALVQKALNEALQFQAKPTDPLAAQKLSAQMMIYSLKSIPNLKLDEIVPGASAAIDKKIADLGMASPFAGANGEWSKYEEAMNGSSPAAALETIEEAPDYMREQLVRNLVQRTASSGNISQAKTIVNDKLKDPRERQRMLIDLERQAAQADANKGDMESALKHVAKLPTLSARAEMISEIASRIGKGQKTATAIRLLETAKSLLGSTIRSESAEQMTALLILGAAFSHYDSKRALEIIEPIIEQFNELAEAAKVLNGFGVDYFQKGELLMNDGNGLSNIAMPLANSLGEISIIDFDKAKQVSERINLPEVRLSLYLGMIQQVIAPGELSIQTTLMRRGVIE